ncbi:MULTISPECIES: FtsW/RodA/SpoVE family cell cycle protein [Bacillus]|uniref:FtsW/RodA/SpoVE family cell cycle protein n=1 Tax=Bacillus TaxID=1386 RepID=UPI00031FD0CD|nr:MULTISPECIES: FtsW/RodA/SpoVE family cell cycle protein [Bacillus]
MQNKSESYLNEVMNQIRSKEAKKYVSEELDFHIKGVKKHLIKNGLTGGEAEAKAIEQMGSPIQLGMELNKIHRPRVDWLMIILLVLTMSLGFLPLLSVGNMDVATIINKGIITILGVGIAFGLMFYDYRKLIQYKWLFLGVGLGILIILQILPNTYVKGNPYFIAGPLSISSSTALPFFFLFWATFFNHKKMTLWQAGGIFFITLFMFLSVGGISISFIYSLMFFVMIWYSHLSFKKIIGFTLSVLGTAVISTFIMWPYVKNRLIGFLDPEKYSDSGGYLYLYMKELLLDAGWFGNANTNVQIPESLTDFVLVSFTYHYGWLLAIILIIVLTLFMIRMIFVVRNINDFFGKMLIVGGVTLFSVQFIYHFFMTIGLLPIISMSLPFISYGIMPTLLYAIIVGIFLSVYRRKNFITSY